MRFWALRLLLVAATVGMAVCARVPEDGAGWRTGFVFCALIAGGLVVLVWKLDYVSRREVLALAILLRVIVFPLMPVLSDDGYRYVWDGALQAESGINPYRYRPADTALVTWHAAPIYEALNSAYYYSVYPPLSQYVFVLGGTVYDSGWRASWWLIKLVFALGEGLGLFLLSRMVRPASLVLYAWHPLVVMEAVGQGHTEALAVGLLVLAIWALRKERFGMASSAIAAAAWVKLYPVVLLPWVWRHAQRRRIGVLLGAGVTTAVLVTPYLAAYTIPHIAESLALYVRLFEFNAGPYDAIKSLIAVVTGSDWGKIIGPLLQFGFLGCLATLTLHAKSRQLRFEPFAFLALSVFFACSTTVHPWYLLSILVLLPLILEEHRALRKVALAWLWLATFSLATYWRYAGPAWGYTAALWIGWGGWAAFLTPLGVGAGLRGLMRHRAASKWRWIKQYIQPIEASHAILDLGAGEGYVGERVAEEGSAFVQLADVLDLNQTTLPHIRYDGRRLPFSNASFDTTLLLFVLHHTADAEVVLAEAKRVTREQLIVMESVYVGEFQHRLLRGLDRLANHLRSAGKMRAQDEHLHFRTTEMWRALFAAHGLAIEAEVHRGRWVHRRVLFKLNPLLQ